MAMRYAQWNDATTGELQCMESESLDEILDTAPQDALNLEIYDGDWEAFINGEAVRVF